MLALEPNDARKAEIARIEYDLRLQHGDIEAAQKLLSENVLSPDETAM